MKIIFAHPPVEPSEPEAIDRIRRRVQAVEKVREVHMVDSKKNQRACTYVGEPVVGVTSRSLMPSEEKFHR